MPTQSRRGTVEDLNSQSRPAGLVVVRVKICDIKDVLIVCCISRDTLGTNIKYPAECIKYGMSFYDVRSALLEMRFNI